MKREKATGTMVVATMIALMFAAFSLVAIPSVQAINEIELEYGDAPDPTYPSLFANNGVRHMPTGTECLGLNFTQGDWKDYEADANEPDGDLFDDGLLTTTITAGNPAQTVNFEVTELMPTPSPLIVNILVDLDGDGDWNDIVGGQPEHVVLNQPMPPGPGEWVITSTPFSTVGATPGPTWLRITLTRSLIPLPWNGTIGVGMYEFAYGETEDWEIYIEEEPTPVPQLSPVGLLALFGILAALLVSWVVVRRK